MQRIRLEYCDLKKGGRESEPAQQQHALRSATEPAGAQVLSLCGFQPVKVRPWVLVQAWLLSGGARATVINPPGQQVKSAQQQYTLQVLPQRDSWRVKVRLCGSDYCSGRVGF
jgi:hypothetical protein